MVITPFGEEAVWELTPGTADFRCRRETVCLVRAEGKDPLDKLVTTALAKDHCEHAAGWKLVSES